MTWRPAVKNESQACINMRWLRDKGIFVRCNRCSHCRVLRGKDWAGRAIAEAQMADRTLFVTLTIGGDRMFSGGVTDNIRAKEFHRDDVTAYIKRLRRYVEPGRMRVFWVGERGDRNCRTHYHLLQYFYGTRGPEGLRLDEKYFHGKMEPGVVEAAPGIRHEASSWTLWPFGMIFVREWQPRHAYYLASYVTKVFRDESGEAERVFYTRPGVSTKPLLGAAYFKWLALRYVEDRLSPQGRTYSFAREKGYTGELAEYWMHDATWRLFVREFVQGWRVAYGDEPWPYSPALEQHLEMMEDRAAGSRPYDWADFDAGMTKGIAEKADFREKLADARIARQAAEDADAVAAAGLRVGIEPYLKRDGIDDPLNAALADMPEDEWRRRFGSFEDHERRWQLEVLRKSGRASG